MSITCKQKDRTDKYSQHSSNIWQVGVNVSGFVYEESGCGFEFRCCHLNNNNNINNNNKIYSTSKIYNNGVIKKNKKQKKLLIKFDEKEYWCEHVSNSSYKP